MEEKLFQLRDCFTAGYTLPQYCIDNGIKKPLFVSEKKYEQFLWDVHVQFHYDKRLLPRFCFIDADEPDNMNRTFSSPLIIKNLSKMNLNVFDKVILLTQENIGVEVNKTISLHKLYTSFISKVYGDIPLLNFLQRYPKVKLFRTTFGKLNVSEDLLRQASWNAAELKKALKSNKKVGKCFDKFNYTNEDILEMFLPPKVITHLDGTTTLADNNHPLIQIQKGKRLTAYQPETYLNKIYFFGVCHHYGTMAPFDKTIESYLQKMLNENHLPYRVENEGQAYTGRIQDIFYNLNKLEPAPGDIIFFYNGFASAAIPFCDVRDAFNSADYREIYSVDAHVNELGYELLAKKYFKFLTENNFFRDVEFKYPLPPPRITDMVYRLGSSRAA